MSIAPNVLQNQPRYLYKMQILAGSKSQIVMQNMQPALLRVMDMIDEELAEN
jgi:hypothetical protein